MMFNCEVKIFEVKLTHQFVQKPNKIKLLLFSLEKEKFFEVNDNSFYF